MRQEQNLISHKKSASVFDLVTSLINYISKLLDSLSVRSPFFAGGVLTMFEEDTHNVLPCSEELPRGGRVGAHPGSGCHLNLLRARARGLCLALKLQLLLLKLSLTRGERNAGKRS